MRPRTWDKSEIGKKWQIKYVAKWKKRNPEKVKRYNKVSKLRWIKKHKAEQEKWAKDIFMESLKNRLKQGRPKLKK